MASTKATFTLDTETITRLRETAERLGRPKSAVVRDAIRDYSERADGLGAEERRRMLAAFDELVPEIPATSADQVDAELAELRKSRRRGGRSTHRVK